MKGSKVYLRAVERKDVELAYKYMNNEDSFYNLSVGVPYPMNFDNEMDWYESQRKKSDSYNFAICTVEDDLYIGGCGINSIDWNNRSCNIGIFIGDDRFKSKGFGTEAMALLLAFIFKQISVERVELRVFGFNDRAIKSYIKNGFVEEGRLRNAIYRNGAFHDEVIMSILRTEYKK
ncbi:GNAT family N-acetyltransferase [Fusibacter ferrireducens]|uniref:GNAT family N-acetyltransferase n=1 Tax=Fusibacter ferrireducens TaxID=2785058 RepID=A0ABR9ZV76_9FIRM|nr:GNAT family protein [Fusibacter ferrireducens]MBF4694361.1 GNAT family N-acetyltransferase [Fusibacter ferrireducens]